MTTHCIILAWRIPWTGEPSWATDGLQSMRLQRVRHNWVTTSHFHMWILLSHTATAKSLQSCLTLCDPIDGSPPGSPVPEILQPRTLEWVAISFSNAWKWKVKVKWCPTLRDPMDRSLPGSPVHGIFQARVLEWGAIAFSENIYMAKSWTQLINSTTIYIHIYMCFNWNIIA